MTKVTVCLEFYVDIENLGAVYSNEDYLSDEIKTMLAYGLYRFDAEDVVFNSVDIEGL